MAMRSPKLSLISILLAILLISSLGFWNSICSAENQGSEEVKELRLQAEILQRILERSIILGNLSKPLRGKIELLLSINLTTLSVEELSQFVADGKNLLLEIRNLVRDNRTQAEQRLTLALFNRIKLRLERAIEVMNLSDEEAEEIKKKLADGAQKNMTLRELHQLVRELVKSFIPHRVQNISSQLINYTEHEAELGELHSLEIAYNASHKVLKVLEAVKERLQNVNASPVAIAAVEHAIGRITSAREVLKRLMERMELIQELGNVSRGDVRREVRSIIEEELEELNETLREKIRELEELREVAQEAGLKELAERFNQTINELEKASTSLELAELGLEETIDKITSIKAVIDHVEEVLKEALKESKLLEKISEELNKKARKLEEKLSDLIKRLDEIRDREEAEEIDRALEDSDEVLKRAEEELREGELESASELLNKAEQMIKMAENKLEDVKRILEERIGPRGSEEAEKVSPPTPSGRP
ncbi:MAG: hypothetical protein DRN59_03545 [Thaumarchaeota archaeon]|nr:MAG: hypothetical protein DRN59_03545 [Nitrososphaerota archaeon]